MRNTIINKSMLLIKSNNPTFSDIKLKEIKYGIESVYLTLTKLIVIFLLSFIFHSLFEALLFILFFNILRLTGFGLHANKSSICWTSSILVFVLLPIIAKYIHLPLIINIVISICSIICYILYAPADTKKRPIINIKKRNIYKLLTIITGIIYFLLIIFTKSLILKDCITYAMAIEAILILPYTYNFFKLPYRNYLSYKGN